MIVNKYKKAQNIEIIKSSVILPDPDFKLCVYVLMCNSLLNKDFFMQTKRNKCNSFLENIY